MKLTMSAEVTKVYKRILAEVRKKGGTVSLGTVGDAAALAEEIESPDPDPERLARMRKRLGLDESERGGRK